jgi:hypothetical protein
MSSKAKEALRKALREAAPDGRISCQEARQVAEEQGIQYSEVGAACNELGIRIHSCQLGCF